MMRKERNEPQCRRLQFFFVPREAKMGTKVLNNTKNISDNTRKYARRYDTILIPLINTD